MPSGVYVAGKSIKSGSYVVLSNEQYDGVEIAVFENEENYKKALAEKNDSLIVFEDYLSEGESAFVKLEDGMVLIVKDTAIVKKADEEWML